MYCSNLCRAHANHIHRYGEPRPLSAKAYTPQERIEMNTQVHGSCLEWTGKVNRAGYPRIGVSGTKVLAHRFVYEVNYGPIPDGLFVDHQCGNTRCLNPEHLRLATPALNMQNLRRVASNSSYARGVHQETRTGRWRARATVNGKTHSFGTFDTPQEAEQAAIAGRMRIHKFNSIDRGLRVIDRLDLKTESEEYDGNQDL